MNWMHRFQQSKQEYIFTCKFTKIQTDFLTSKNHHLWEVQCKVLQVSVGLESKDREVNAVLKKTNGLDQLNT